MITRYFGLPGAGKTSLACKLAIDEVKRISLGLSKYQYVFTNFDVKHPFVFKVENDMIGKYNFQNCLLIIDEAYAFAGARNWKGYSVELMEYMNTHRHYVTDVDRYRNDIVIISQGANAIDSSLRQITEKCCYIRKSKLNPNKTKIIELILTPIIPVKKGIMNEQGSGDVAEDIPIGYQMPGILGQLRSPSFDRRPYYQYFDTCERKKLPDVPGEVFIKSIKSASE